MNKLQQYKNLVITTNTETILANIDLIQKYSEKISRLKKHEYSYLFKDNITRYEKTIQELKQENIEYLKEIEEVKEMKEV